MLVESQLLIGLAGGLLSALAACAVLTAWFKQNGPFTVPRAYAEAGTGWISKMLTCPICMTFHVTFWLIVVFVVPGLIWPVLLPWCYLPLVWLAATTIAHNIGHKGES